MDNNEFHRVIWRTMCDDFMDGAYFHYTRFKEPSNVFESKLNDFLDAYPELGDEVKMIFTN